MPQDIYVLTDDAGQPHDVHVIWREKNHENGRRHGVDRTVWYRGDVILASSGNELIEERRGGRWRATFSTVYYNGQIPKVIEA